jgi:aromatic-L-amino-acid/L-tryptophan decarboxylase
MSPDEFRKYGHEAVEWIAEYLENTRSYPVLAQVRPGDLIDALPESAPEQGEPMGAIFEDFKRLIVPGITHWNHPRFMAYFSISGSPPGILAEMLIAALNVNGMVWKSSPACTELEQVTMGWLRQWLGLPDDFFGIIYDTASISTMHAIAAARERIDPQARTRGAAPDLVLYASEQAHSSIEKGAIALGIGQNNVRKIATDSAWRMRPEALVEAIHWDQMAGRRPFCVVATVGTTSTTSIDPVPAVLEIARKNNLWLHVDAAYGGSAAVVPELGHILEGVGEADSVVMNPHKWLLTPTDLSAFFTRHPDVLKQAFSLVPEYLRTADDPRAVNLMDYGVQLGRRFRALKLWFVMRAYGRQGIAAILRNHIRWAQDLAALIRADERFEVSAPVPFSLVCFRYRGTNDQNRALLDRLNATGQVFLSHTVLNGQFVLRAAIGNFQTTWDDVKEMWEQVQALAPSLSEVTT